jgi:hypothetical protein
MLTQTFEKRIYVAVLSLSKFAVALLLAAPSLAGAETTKKFESRQLKEDFQIARRALEEAHPGLYRYTKKAELDRIFNEAEKSLDHPMDFYEFYRVMALPIAAIKCGHTDIDLSPDARQETERLPWLPFDVKVLGCKVYIFRDYAKGGALAGKEIQSINGVPAVRIPVHDACRRIPGRRYSHFSPEGDQSAFRLELGCSARIESALRGSSV